MRLNISKSKIMVMGVNSRAGRYAHKINDVIIEEVADFTYLGLSINKWSVISNMSSKRVQLLKLAIKELRETFLRNPHIDVIGRLQFVQSMIYSVALYGGEIFASECASLEEMHSLIYQVVTKICGLYRGSNKWLTLIDNGINIPQLAARQRQLKFCEK